MSDCIDHLLTFASEAGTRKVSGMWKLALSLAALLVTPAIAQNTPQPGSPASSFSGCGGVNPCPAAQGGTGVNNGANTLTLGGAFTINGTTGSTLNIGTGGALTAGAYAAAGQLPGTATNDNATAGNVGEYQQTGLNNIASGTTVTISQASPAVITYTAHPFSATCLNGATGVKCVQPVFFTTSIGLPSPLVASTTYYVDPASITTNTFQIATTAVNALAGTDINTTTSGSGTQTAFAAATAATNNIFSVFALQLSAGDWRISFHPVCNGGSTTLVQYLQSAAFNTAAGLATPASGGTTEWSWGVTGVALFAENAVSLNVDGARFSTAGTALVYGNIDSLYTTSTLFCTGSLSATRVR